MQHANTGWLFYRDYYRGINFRAREDDKKNEETFGHKNRQLFNKLFDPATAGAFVRTEQSLKFETTYPGLLIGTGYTHETGLLGEIKIGFHFDHTTGMPYLPGSSVKGVLRAAFEQKHYLKKFLLAEVLKWEPGRIAQLDPDQLVAEIFEGSGKKNMNHHDVFHDAIITRGNEKGHFLGPDFITPHHHNLLHNPVPIQLMKILPGVEISFFFELKDGMLTAVEKLKLFNQIIRHTGVGAKTNVGYGWLK